jgi:hypothetical protein
MRSGQLNTPSTIVQICVYVLLLILSRLCFHNFFIFLKKIFISSRPELYDIRATKFRLVKSESDPLYNSTQSKLAYKGQIV